MSKIDYTGQLDQEWAEARDWFEDHSRREAGREVLCRITVYCSADDPKQLISAMVIDPRLADCIQRLALLALHQLAVGGNPK